MYQKSNCLYHLGESSTTGKCFYVITGTGAPTCPANRYWSVPPFNISMLVFKRAKDTYSKRLLLAGHIHAIHQNVRFSILNSSVPHLIYASVLVFEIIAKNENFLFNMGLNGENMKNGNLTLKN